MHLPFMGGGFMIKVAMLNPEVSLFCSNFHTVHGHNPSCVYYDVFFDLSASSACSAWSSMNAITT